MRNLIEEENFERKEKNGNLNIKKWYESIDKNEFELIKSKDIILVEDIHKKAEFNLSAIYNKNPIRPIAVRKLENDKYGLVCGLRSYLKIKIFNLYKANVFITDLNHSEFIEKYKCIERDGNNYKKRIARMLDIYLYRTGFKWEDLKYLILKNKDVLSFFDERFIKWTNINEAAHNLIALTLLKDLKNLNWSSRINLDGTERKVLDFLKTDELPFLVREDFLEDFHEYTKNIKF